MVRFCKCLADAFYSNRSCHLSPPPFSEDIYNLTYSYFTGLCVLKTDILFDYYLLNDNPEIVSSVAQINFSRPLG